MDFCEFKATVDKVREDRSNGETELTALIPASGKPRHYPRARVEFKAGAQVLRLYSVCSHTEDWILSALVEVRNL